MPLLSPPRIPLRGALPTSTRAFPPRTVPVPSHHKHSKLRKPPLEPLIRREHGLPPPVSLGWNGLVRRVSEHNATGVHNNHSNQTPSHYMPAHHGTSLHIMWISWRQEASDTNDGKSCRRHVKSIAFMDLLHRPIKRPKPTNPKTKLSPEKLAHRFGPHL